MNKIILIGFILAMAYSGYSQNKLSVKFQSPVIKYMDFKDTTLDSDKKVYVKCQKWKLSKKDISYILTLVKPISSEEKAGLYNWLPCYFRSKVLYKGCIYTMEINAASFIVLYNKKATLYFGCSSTACESFFVLAGGNG